MTTKITLQLLEQLTELERTLMREDVRADASVLTKMLDPSFIEISADGRRFDRQNVLERLPKEQAKGRKPTFRNQDFEARKLSEHIVQLSYRAALRRVKGGPWHYSVRMSIWRLDEHNEWRILYHQGTPCDSFQFAD